MALIKKSANNIDKKYYYIYLFYFFATMCLQTLFLLILIGNKPVILIPKQHPTNSTENNCVPIDKGHKFLEYFPTIITVYLVTISLVTEGYNKIIFIFCGTFLGHLNILAILHDHDDNMEYNIFLVRVMIETIIALIVVIVSLLMKPKRVKRQRYQPFFIEMHNLRSKV